MAEEEEKKEETPQLQIAPEEALRMSGLEGISPIYTPIQHKHTGSDTPKVSYDDLTNKPDLTILDYYVNKYKDFVSDSDLAVNDAISVREATNPGHIRLSKALDDDEKCWGFIGFSKEAGTATFTATTQIAGVVSGFTGLTPGADYYLTDTLGAIGTAAGTYKYRVGIALSATELWICPNAKQNYSIPSGYIASDTLLTSTDLEETTTAVAYTIIKSIRVNGAGKLRVKFDHKVVEAPGDCFGRIYKNGVALGTEYNNTTGSYITRSEDLSFTAGDTIDLYGYTSGGHTGYFRNFRIYGTSVTGFTIINT